MVSKFETEIYLKLKNFAIILVIYLTLKCVDRNHDNYSVCDNRAAQIVPDKIKSGVTSIVSGCDFGVHRYAQFEIEFQFEVGFFWPKCSGSLANELEHASLITWSHVTGTSANVYKQTIFQLMSWNFKLVFAEKI